MKKSTKLNIVAESNAFILEINNYYGLDDPDYHVHSKENTAKVGSIYYQTDNHLVFKPNQYYTFTNFELLEVSELMDKLKIYIESKKYNL